MDEEPKPVEEAMYADDVDIFGQITSKLKFPLIICPHCQTKQEATNFTSHLGKCMGLGRQSSRLASKRLAVNALDDSYSDDENDSDWEYNSNKKKERKAFLNRMCSVIPKNAKKLCTKQKYSQPSDEHRRDDRHSLLGRGYMTEQLVDNVQIDVDTVDEGSCLSRFWDQTISRSPSPSLETIPTTSTSKIMGKSTSSSFRKRKSLGPSNLVYSSNQGSSSSSSFEPVDDRSN